MKIIERISRPQLNGLVTNTLREPSANFMLWVQLFSIMRPEWKPESADDCRDFIFVKAVAHESKEYHNRNIKDIVAYRKGTSHT